MSVHDHEHDHRQRPARFGTPMVLMLLAGLAVVGGLLLLTQYPAGGYAALIYVPLLLLCPLMHFFMHGKHGRHGS